jgi:hypothetical protein
VIPRARSLIELGAALQSDRRTDVVVEDDSLSFSTAWGGEAPLLVTWRKGDRLVRILQTTPVCVARGARLELLARLLPVQGRLGFAQVSVDDESGMLGVGSHTFASEDGQVDAPLVSRLASMLTALAEKYVPLVEGRVEPRALACAALDWCAD